ncbi:MAG: DHH family phosphoesterase [candidate division WOR-3 bacterium]
MNIKFDNLSEGIKELLRKREVYDDETLERFINPSFDHLRPCYEILKPEIEMVKEFIKKGKRILIWGDEDIDGITSTLIMKFLFKDLFDIEVSYYIPNREKEGYGLSKGGIDKAQEQGIDLIITVDSGTDSFEEVEYLKSKGMEVIITDHHELKEKIPKVPFLNPKFLPFGYKNLAGAGVAFKFADCIYYEYKGEKAKTWTKKIPEIPILAFIGTIVDKVPLVDENRILYCEGLKLLKEAKKPPFSLFSNKNDILNELKPISSGKSNLIFKFFSADSIEEADRIYGILKSNYKAWDKNVREEFLAIKEELENGKRVVFRKNLNYKIASGLANRAKDFCKAPVVVIYSTGSSIRGECRGPSDSDLLSLLKKLEYLLIDYGGHKSACGFTLERENIEEFKEKMELLLKEYKKEKPPTVELKLEEITPDLQKLIKKMEPFGIGNYFPIFLIRNVNYFNEGNSSFLSNEKASILITEIREIPPASMKINAYLEIYPEKIILKGWENV